MIHVTNQSSIQMVELCPIAKWSVIQTITLTVGILSVIHSNKVLHVQSPLLYMYANQ